MVAPENRVEFGCVLMLRWAYPFCNTDLDWFLEGGSGPMYMTQKTREQGTQFNFINYLGAGCVYHLSEATEIEAGVRYRHVSNAGLDEDNSGIDGVTGLVGVIRHF